MGVCGYVFNDTRGVTIEVQGDDEKLAEFCQRLQTPGADVPLMKVVSCHVEDIPPVDGADGFVILSSDQGGEPISQVTVDTAVCRNCLEEMNDESDFRYRYPFINCTNCGPRYSIVKTIPYDRCNTTMNLFRMCDACGGQYTDPADRRFHAQPVACPKCGPKIWLTDKTGSELEIGTDQTLKHAAELLTAGKVLAIKGIGGFHLAVDALNEEAVSLLRKRKKRDHKPFALMARNIEKIKEYCEVSETEEQLLKSPQSPIVLLKRKASAQVPEPVAQGLDTLGFVLCYGPLHFLLFDQPGIDVLVMTSANLSDEPLICDNDEAVARLADVVDAFVMHDRNIYRQVDDSVVHVVGGGRAMIRRSRGYVPDPVLMAEPAVVDVFAAGADLKNTFCFAKGNQLLLSEHIGDLDNALTYRHYGKSVDHLRQLFEVNPSVVACDLHPGYLSTGFAENYAAKNGIERIVRIQHHWAHIGSVLAEFGCDEKVIGIVADGTGYGTDGAVWGCECLIASLDDFRRVGHLEYFDLPGADAASKEAIRPVMGMLSAIDGDYLAKYSQVLTEIEPDTEKINIIASQLEKGLNTVKTSSAGRLFDAAAAIAGLGSRNDFQAQLPMTLEAAIGSGIEDSYSLEHIAGNDGTMLLGWRSLIDEMLGDALADVGSDVMAAKFHNCLANGMLWWAQTAREKFDINTVALSGGVFCNRYLSNQLITLLKIDGFRVLFKKDVPANDGGISLGQAAIAVAVLSK
jgi:hydrogenase maturation protein HypF